MPTDADLRRLIADGHGDLAREYIAAQARDLATAGEDALAREYVGACVHERLLTRAQGEAIVQGLALIEPYSQPIPGSDIPYHEWVRQKFPQATQAPFAARHLRLGAWFDSLVPGKRPRTAVEPWPRGGAKSSGGELGTVHVGCKLTRRFCLYVSSTQEKADPHVQAVGARFESIGVERAITKYGHSKGWRRDQLRTAHGFNVAALGLDVGSRGIKFDDYRPDLIIFDDIDERHDSKATTQKKIELITQSILPAGSSDLAVLFLQNLIIKDGIMAQLCDGRADFLLDRSVAVIEPAVNGLEFERRFRDDGTRYYVITGGTPTWEGQDLKTCEAQMNLWGRPAFLREAQHRVNEEEGGLWDRKRDIEPFRVVRHPPLIRVGIGVDPSASTTGDEAGIVAAGVAMQRPCLNCQELCGVDTPLCPHCHGTRFGASVLHGYVLGDASKQGSPNQWAQEAVTAHYRHNATVPIIAESNNGGEMVRVTINTIKSAPQVELIHASRGKLTRAEPVQSLYEEGLVHHVGEFEKLESEMCNYHPGDDSPNRMDALVWILTKLMLVGTNTISRETDPQKRRRFGYA